MPRTKNRNILDKYLDGLRKYSVLTDGHLSACLNDLHLARNLDSSFTRPLAECGYATMQGALLGLGTNKREMADWLTCQAMDEDPLDFRVAWARAFVLLNMQDEALRNEALALYKQAARDFNEDENGDVHVEYGEALIYMGKLQEGCDEIERGIAHYPKPRGWHHWDRAWVHYFQKEYQEALDDLAQVKTLAGEATDEEIQAELDDPASLLNYPRYLVDAELLRAACHARLGQVDEGQKAMRLFRTRRPDWDMDDEKDSLAFSEKDPNAQQYYNDWLTGVQNAFDLEP